MANGVQNDMRKFLTATKPLGLSFLVIFLMSVQASSQRADITYRNSRGAEKVEKRALITEWTYKSIKFKGRKREVNADSLVSVAYLSQPDIFVEANEMLEDGDLRSALAVFLEIIDGKNAEQKDLRKSQLWCQEPALYHAWTISRRIGRLDDAKAHRTALIKAYPKSHYLPEILLREAGDLYAVGEFAKAEAAFISLGDKANTSKFANHYKVMAGIGLVRTLLGAGKVAAAQAAQASVSAKALSESARLRCELIKGEVMVAEKKIGAAESLFKQILENADFKTQPYIFAGAANGVADCLYASRKFKDAMFAYSKTFALFAGKEGLDHENGWSFWRFANCCKQIAAKLDGQDAKVYAFRFRKTRDQVSVDYRLSRGGQLARREKGQGK